MQNIGNIDTCQVIFVYERDIDIRKKVFEFENELDIFFQHPFRVINVPDQEDGNIPRFEALAKESKLNVSQFRATYVSLFKDPYRLNVAKIREIISKRVEKLIPLVLKEKMEFVAYIIEMIYPYESDNEIFELFKKNTNATPLQDPVVEFQIFYAKTYKDKYFINIRCARGEHLFEEREFNSRSKIETIKSSKTEKGIIITIDLNTRYSFVKDGKFDRSLLDHIDEDAFNLLSNNCLENYLTGRII